MHFVIGEDTLAAGYDANGNKVRLRVMVQATRNGVTTTYIGSQRSPMRTNQSGSDVLQYILSDHLGSTSTSVDASGDYVSRTGYMPWGGERFTTADIPTDYRYTGQRLEGDLGIYYYNARWYDPSIGRFLQADSIVPVKNEGNSSFSVGDNSGLFYSTLTVDYHESQFLNQVNEENEKLFTTAEKESQPVPTNSIAYDRYAYAFNNPIRYNDPSGHFGEGIIALSLVSPVGWFVIGAAAIGVGVYYTVPGAREALAEGIDQVGEATSNGLQTLFARPRNNQEQNKQFRGAVRELERQLGRPLTRDESQELHEALHSLGDPGFWDIVEEGKNLFDFDDDDNEEEVGEGE